MSNRQDAAVPCPVCGAAVPGAQINQHLDRCLEKSESQQRPPQQPPQQQRNPSSQTPAPPSSAYNNFTGYPGAISPSYGFPQHTYPKPQPILSYPPPHLAPPATGGYYYPSQPTYFPVAPPMSAPSPYGGKLPSALPPQQPSQQQQQHGSFMSAFYQNLPPFAQGPTSAPQQQQKPPQLPPPLEPIKSEIYVQSVPQQSVPQSQQTPFSVPLQQAPSSPQFQQPQPLPQYLQQQTLPYLPQAISYPSHQSPQQQGTSYAPYTSPIRPQTQRPQPQQPQSQAAPIQRVQSPHPQSSQQSPQTPQPVSMQHMVIRTPGPSSSAAPVSINSGYPAQFYYKNLAMPQSPQSSSHPSSPGYQLFWQKYQQMQYQQQQQTNKGMGQGGWINMCLLPSKVFNQQWVHVHSGTLFCYDQIPPMNALTDKTLGHCRHVIPLRLLRSFISGTNAARHTRKKFSFVIELTDNTVYYFATATLPEVDKWATIIKKEVELLQMIKIQEQLALKPPPATTLTSTPLMASPLPSDTTTTTTTTTTKPKRERRQVQPMQTPPGGTEESSAEEPTEGGQPSTGDDKATTSATTSTTTTKKGGEGASDSAAPTSTPTERKRGGSTSLFGKTLQGLFSVFSEEYAYKQQDEEWMEQLQMNSEPTSVKQSILAHLNKVLLVKGHPLGKRVVEFVAEFNKNKLDYYQKPAEEAVPALASHVLFFMDGMIAVIKSYFPVVEQVTDCNECCTVALENAIFSDIYPVVFSLYSKKHKEEDSKYFEKVQSMSSVKPSDLIDTQRFWLHNNQTDESVHPEVALQLQRLQEQLQQNFIRPDKDAYHAAISMLRSLPTLQTPTGKLNCLVETNKLICEAVEEFWKDRLPAKDLVIACDDLLPILSYVIVKSGVKCAYSEGCFIQDFLQEKYKMGMEGYSLATFQAACASLFCERTDEEEENFAAGNDNGDDGASKETTTTSPSPQEAAVEEKEENGEGKVTDDGTIIVDAEHKKEENVEEGGEERKDEEEKTVEEESRVGPMLLRGRLNGVSATPKVPQPLIPVVTTSSSGEIEMEEIDDLPVPGWTIN